MLLTSAALAQVPASQPATRGTTPPTTGQGTETRPSSPMPVNEMAAQVENTIITWTDIRRELMPLLPQIQAESTSERDFQRRLNELGRQILNDLIDRQLIIRDFEKEGFQIPSDFLKNAFDDYITDEFSGNRAEFLQFLQAQGISELQFRRQLRERIIVDYMRGQRLGSRTAISPRQIQEFYEAENNRSRFFQEEGVKLRMITLSVPALQTVEQLTADAAELVQRLRQGANFAEAAMRLSTDGRARAGGDWGWVARNTLRPELAAVAFNLAPGQTSDPIALGNSVYILRVEDKREAGVQSLDKVSGEIEQAIATQLARQANDRWLQRLRSEYFWQIFADNMAALYSGPAEPTTVERRIGTGASPANPESAAASPPGTL